jgi:hypothetical protein
MEYYLAVRMGRFGRAFQPAESTPSTQRPPDRTMPRSQPSGNGPVVAGVGPASGNSTARPMGRSMGGRPGRP